MKKLILRATLLIFALSFSLGFCYRVDDFRVSDSIPPSEFDGPLVGTDFKGKFIVSWVDFSVFEHRKVDFKEFRVDGTPVSGQMQAPDIIEQGQRLNDNGAYPAILPNGNIVLIRTMEKDSTDAQRNFYGFTRGYVEILDSLGNPLLPTFLVDTLTPATHKFRFYDGVAVDKNGNFTVLFYALGNWDKFFQQFFPNGQKRGSLHQIVCDNIDSCHLSTQHPAISMNRDGQFIVSWDAGAPQVPFAKIFKADGTPLLPELVLSCDDTLTQYCVPPAETSYHCLVASAPKIGIDSMGNFMAAYNACVPDPTGKHVYARVYDSLGNPKTPNMEIGDLELTYDYFHRPRVLATGDGGFVVIWADYENNPNLDIWAKRFDASGHQVGIKYRINNPIGSVSNSEVFGAAICDDHLFVAWRDRRDQPGLASSIYAQIMPVNEIGVFTPGDVNYDYSLSLADVIGMVNYIFKGTKYAPEGSPLVCDVNGDCKVSLVDVIYLVNYIFKPGWPSPVGCPM